MYSHVCVLLRAFALVSVHMCDHISIPICICIFLCSGEHVLFCVFLFLFCLQNTLKRAC